jgi:hypothetical protein
MRRANPNGLSVRFPSAANNSVQNVTGVVAVDRQPSGVRRCVRIQKDDT